MGKNIKQKLILTLTILVVLIPSVTAQPRPTPDPELIAKRNQIEKELNEMAVVDRKVMVPMRDGKRMAADIYRPKDASKQYPIIFSRTPYNFNFWDVRLGAPRDMTTILEAVKRGYAYVVMNERVIFSRTAITTFLDHPRLTAMMQFRGCLINLGQTKKLAPSVVHQRLNGKWRWRRAAIRLIPR